ncbi:hypothetical protein CTheo_8748 [Ceratobasidium theobromae]|uniref:Uncharacterized protein n=1 Tax=Ceratobasidium theobromae TaxID=1582974 RepID=A0A5N5Q7R0_9AGAM|nr:hypothetical protein CTheo_8748 [Ceratobasidium theobromae]
MADSLEPHTAIWPSPQLRIVEHRLHELIARPPRLEHETYGIFSALLSCIYPLAESPEAASSYFVHPQGPLRSPLDEQQAPLLPSSKPGPSTSVDLPTEPEPDWDTTIETDSVGSATSSVDCSAGNNSGPNSTFEVPIPPPGDISVTNTHIPVAGRGQGRLLPGDVKYPDFIVYQVNPNGCLAVGGGPDVIRLVVEIKNHPVLEFTTADANQIWAYASRLWAMNAVEAGLLVILQTEAYFWAYDELNDYNSFSPAAIIQRPHHQIDSLNFVNFLCTWEREWGHVTF